MPSKPLEVCICAAIQLQDGRVIRGHRHDDCLQTAMKWRRAGQEVGSIQQAAQGFLTSHERFVSREEGARLTYEAGRLSAQTGAPFTSNLLFSEDLY